MSRKKERSVLIIKCLAYLCYMLTLVSAITLNPDATTEKLSKELLERIAQTEDDLQRDLHPLQIQDETFTEKSTQNDRPIAKYLVEIQERNRYASDYLSSSVSLDPSGETLEIIQVTDGVTVTETLTSTSTIIITKPVDGTTSLVTETVYISGSLLVTLDENGSTIPTDGNSQSSTLDDTIEVTTVIDGSTETLTLDSTTHVTEFIDGTVNTITETIYTSGSITVTLDENGSTISDDGGSQSSTSDNTIEATTSTDGTTVTETYTYASTTLVTESDDNTVTETIYTSDSISITLDENGSTISDEGGSQSSTSDNTVEVTTVIDGTTETLTFDSTTLVTEFVDGTINTITETIYTSGSISVTLDENGSTISDDGGSQSDDGGSQSSTSDNSIEVTTVIDGSTETLSFDSTTRITEFTDGTINTITETIYTSGSISVTLDENGSTISDDGGSQSSTSDNSIEVTTVIDGSTKTLSFDSTTRVTEFIDGTINTITETIYTSGSISVTLDENGSTISNDGGSQSDDGGSQSSTSDNSIEVTTVIDGSTETLSFDSTTRVTEFIDGTINTITETIYTSGSISVTLDENGSTISDDGGSQSDGGGSQSSTLDNSIEVTTVIDGSTKTLSFDSTTDVTEFIDGTINTITETIYTSGSISVTLDENGSTISDDGGSQSDDGGSQSSTSDNSIEVTTVIDGSTKTLSFDSTTRVTEFIDGTINTISETIYTSGSISVTLDENGSTISDDGGSQTSTSDNTIEVTTVIDGSTETLSFDSTTRVTEFIDGTINTITETIYTSGSISVTLDENGSTISDDGGSQSNDGGSQSSTSDNSIEVTTVIDGSTKTLSFDSTTRVTEFTDGTINTITETIYTSGSISVTLDENGSTISDDGGSQSDDGGSQSSTSDNSIEVTTVIDGSTKTLSFDSTTHVTEFIDGTINTITETIYTSGSISVTLDENGSTISDDGGSQSDDGGSQSDDGGSQSSTSDNSIEVTTVIDGSTETLSFDSTTLVTEFVDGTINTITETIYTSGSISVTLDENGSTISDDGGSQSDDGGSQSSTSDNSIEVTTVIDGSTETLSFDSTTLVTQYMNGSPSTITETIYTSGSVAVTIDENGSTIPAEGNSQPSTIEGTIEITTVSDGAIVTETLTLQSTTLIATTIDGTATEFTETIFASGTISATIDQNGSTVTADDTSDTSTSDSSDNSSTESNGDSNSAQNATETVIIDLDESLNDYKNLIYNYSNINNMTIGVSMNGKKKCPFNKVKPFFQQMPSEVESMGYGLKWVADDNAFFLTDRYSKQLLKFSPSSGKWIKQMLDEEHIESIIPTTEKDIFVIVAKNLISSIENDFEQDGVIVKYKKQFAHFDSATGFGGARLDPAGRLWLSVRYKMNGTDHENLYMIYNGTATVQENSNHKTGGMAWSPNNQLLYITDLESRIIYAYDYNDTTGNINNRQMLTDFNMYPNFSGLPYNIAVDNEGNLWVTMFGNSEIVKINAVTGKVTKIVGIPQTYPLSVAFGGPTLDTLFVTTAFNPDPVQYPFVYAMGNLGVEGFNPTAPLSPEDVFGSTTMEIKIDGADPQPSETTSNIPYLECNIPESDQRYSDKASGCPFAEEKPGVQVTNVYIETSPFGIHYSLHKDALFFADSLKPGVVQWKNGNIKTLTFEDVTFVSTIIPIKGESKRYVIAEDRKIVMLEHSINNAVLSKSNKEILAQLDDNDQNIVFSAGKTDSKGRLWIGTMQLVPRDKHTSKLYVLTKNSLKEVDGDVNNPGGMAWSNDKTAFYLVDKGEKVIYKYSYDEQSGDIDNREIFFALYATEFRNYTMSSIVIDNQNNIWVTIYGGYSVICINRVGVIKHQITLPEKYVSAIDFGGKNRDILYVVTARDSSGSCTVDNQGRLYAITNLGVTAGQLTTDEFVL